MSALNLRLPDSIHRHIREIAEREGVSINSFITTAVSEKISALMTQDYLSERAVAHRKGHSARSSTRCPTGTPCPATNWNRVSRVVGDARRCHAGDGSDSCSTGPPSPLTCQNDAKWKWKCDRSKRNGSAPSLDDVYAILSKRFNSGEHDVARHNEHQP